MPGAIVTRWLLLLRHFARHPAIYGTLLVLAIMFSLSISLANFEKSCGGPYSTFGSAAKAILILVLSGFDMEPPRSTGGLVCAFGMLVVGMCYVTLMTGLMAVYILENRLRKGLTSGRLRVKDHILLCGCLERSEEVLKQFFADDLDLRREVVIVDPNIDKAPMDHPLLKVIKGDPTQQKTLERANVHEAYAAVLLSDRNGETISNSDARNLLIALAIETANAKVYTCVEVLDPENIKHFERVHVDEIISVTEITEHLVVQAALFPGSAELISDMLRFDDGDEIYSLEVPGNCTGKTFADVASQLLQNSDILLIGVRTSGNVPVATDLLRHGKGRLTNFFRKPRPSLATGKYTDGRSKSLVGRNRNSYRLREGDTLYLLSPQRVRSLDGLVGDEPLAASGSNPAPVAQNPSSLVAEA